MKAIYNDPSYKQWRCDFALACHDKGIIIPAICEYDEAIQTIYILSKNDGIDECIIMYLKFCKKWETLTTGYQQ